MKLLLCFAVCATVALSKGSVNFKNVGDILHGVEQAPQNMMAMDQSIVDAVNANPKSTWTASVQKYYKGWTLEEAKASMGVKPPTSFPPLIDYSKAAVSPPASFRSVDKWPGCIGPILNQAKCGSCWAFGATEAISDRLCISGKQPNANGTFLQLGPLDLTTCGGQGGCFGGELYGAWLWAQYDGLTTESCRPYNQPTGPIQPCPGNPHNPMDNPCTDFQQTPACTKQCDASTVQPQGQTYAQSKHKISSVYGVNGEANMMAEIYQNGPIESAFTVYADFLHYENGVYQHLTGQALGGHAIKIIGWGEENGTPFWWVQNSWTTEWASLGGYFKIIRGQDSCGIESAGMAGAV